MRCGYKQSHLCKYYNGFLGKITDFRKCNKMVDDSVGMYQIKDIKLSNHIKRLNDVMNIYTEYNIYPSPELEFLLDNDCSFNIIAGCWGTSNNKYFDFDDDFWDDKDNIFYPPKEKFLDQITETQEQLNFSVAEKNEWLKKNNEIKKLNKFNKVKHNWLDFADRLSKKRGIKYYCKYVGDLYRKNEFESYNIQGDEDYLKNLLQVVDYDTYKYFEGMNELQVCYKKKHQFHASQISSFITSYMRLNVMEQLLSMDFNDIIRVCVDGIYYTGDYEYKNAFREKPEIIKNNSCCGTYISNNYPISKKNMCSNPDREHNDIELHKGPGGTGKTTYNLNDKGFCRVGFFAPSWKLARCKEDENGKKGLVWNKLLSDDPNVWRLIQRYYNVLVVDEVSMMTEQQRKLIQDRFYECKIIFCGDCGFQLDPFTKDNGIVIPFNEENFLNEEGKNKVIEHNTNYRVKCPIFKKHLSIIRWLMENNKSIRNYVKKNFTNIKQEEMIYDVNDMILSRTHIKKNIYSEKYSDLEKYYIEDTNRNYSKGQIIIGDKPDIKCVKQHAFTIHSIQGETAENKLFIDMDMLYDNKIIYTAISRSRRMENIFLIV
jgi:hypothetical protein